MAAATAARPTVTNIQGIRGWAAVLVTFRHFAESDQIQLSPYFGVYAIHLFFMISGFIIMYTAGQDATKFAVRRVIRVIPMYWVFTVLWMLASKLSDEGLITGSDGQPVQTVDLGRLVKTLLFIPNDPIMTRGYTLNYEMVFYALFALGMYVSVKRAPLLCSLGIAAFYGLARLLDLSYTGPFDSVLGFYGSPVILMFIFGIVLYYAWEWSRRTPAFAEAVRRHRWSILVVSLAALALATWSESQQYTYGDAWLIPTAIVMCTAAVMLETHAGWRFKETGFSAKLGDASYSMYMIHPFIILPLQKGLYYGSAGLPLWQKLLLFGVVIVPVTVASFACYRVFEAPVTKHLNDRYRRFAGRGRATEAHIGGHAP